MKLNDHCTLNAEGTFHSRLGTPYVNLYAHGLYFVFKCFVAVTYEEYRVGLICVCSDPSLDSRLKKNLSAETLLNDLAFLTIFG